MTFHLSLSLYWLLLPLGAGLLLWAAPRESETGGYLPSFAPLFRMAAAVVIFFVILSILLGINLWRK
jgi:hypothetical protein